MVTAENGVKPNLKDSHMRWMKPILDALKELGGEASPAEVRERIADDLHLTQEKLAVTRGKTKANKFGNEVAFARNALVFGGYIDGSERGIWKLTDSGTDVTMTDELASSLIREQVRYNREQRAKRTTTDNALGDSGEPEKRYWSYRAGTGAEKWQECLKGSVMMFGYGKIGTLTQYRSQNEIQQALQDAYEWENKPTNTAHALWEFVNEINPGDMIVAVDGKRRIIGIGEVQSGYEHYASDTDDFNHARQVSWTDMSDEYILSEAEKQFHTKMLNEITSNLDMVRQINDLLDDGTDDTNGDNVSSMVVDSPLPAYTREDFLNEVYVDERTYDNLVAALARKKNIILMGAPGVGKTFMAKRLAYSIMGEKDSERVEMVQFHQNYSYEDFMLGYRPTDTGFELKYGVFYEFCKRAEIDEDRPYYFIIDEINRGNLSKIFGELFMLMESDKRGLRLQLPYADELFSIPRNVFIIGMMNTADRSLAMIDYALRRRFAFIELEPGFDTDGFDAYRRALNSERFNGLIAAVRNLNRRIAEDDSLGKGFRIGHSYFCGLTPDTVNEQTLSGLVEYELIPLLEEYWFDEPEIVKEEADKLRKAIQ
ncbi:AAA family ATPase [Bifidobacterium simiarum]|uniref:AAA+ ATPase domain-containing protein n=1 Tax=Bifidobacterium simiarum TaxID=2045441 RepID=A0A2M9HE94_9BIFI|nr:AAA family ATPase [Bifidobacterium simiarum]PJM75121.1 hypothetical protein CSQ87_05855 [Bifidobacterium simiarum]